MSQEGPRHAPERVAPPRHHVLLVGIDAYLRVEPLHGAVNDVDALEALLVERLGVPPASITKLVAPHPWHKRRPRLREDIPTADRLRAALEALAGSEVRQGDRVFIHYSGHGTQVLPRHARVAREALVPVDALAGGELLFDHEINDVLRRIAVRTEDLTVVLDCCCSAGATRSALAPADSAVRHCFIDAPDALPRGAPRAFGEAEAGLLAPFDPSDPGFLVVASAQASEAAHEGRDARGVHHGAFTAALLALIARAPDGALVGLRWADLWQDLRARVAAAFPSQHPCLLGRAERRLFGGPFRRQDPGYPVTEVDGHYRIHAGTLGGLGPGATVAVYGPAPDFFPPLDSPADLAARRGLVRVEAATPSSSTAAPVGARFSLGPGARGRLVTPGKGDALVVGLAPFDAELAQWLEQEAPLTIVPGDAPGELEKEALVGLAPDGRLWIGDEVHGREAPLAWVPAGDRAALVRGLLHYARYNLPLRLARRGRDLPGALRIGVLDARASATLAPDELHDPPLPEAAPDREGGCSYRIHDGQPVCFTVENRAHEPLYAHLLNCSASGRVELLGATQLEIAPRRRGTFWLRGHLGRPFPCRVSAGRTSNIERLIVVATTSPDADLAPLRVTTSFEEAIGAQPREMLPDEEEPGERWTAARVLVRIVRGVG